MLDMPEDAARHARGCCSNMPEDPAATCQRDLFMHHATEDDAAKRCSKREAFLLSGASEVLESTHVHTANARRRIPVVVCSGFTLLASAAAVALWCRQHVSELGQVRGSLQNVAEDMSKGDLKNYTEKLREDFENKAGHFVSLGQGTACRMGPEDNTITPPHGQVTENVTKDNCETSCYLKDGCRGYEFRFSEGRCELWYEAIGGHAHVFYEHSVRGKPDFECVLKMPTCATLKVHHQVFVSAVKDLSAFVKTKCEEGPSDQRYGKCSYDYVANVVRTEENLCKETMAECGTPTCDNDAEIPSPQSTTF